MEKEEELHFLLPFKRSDGRWIQQQPAVISKTGDGSSTASDAEDDLLEVPDITLQGQGEESCEPTAVECFVESQKLLEEKKKEMQECVRQLLEDPAGNVVLLKQLRVLCSERRPEIAVEVRKLAIGGFLEVIKDIAPGYRIRELTESEKAVKVSKDVRKLRHFEQTLVLEYRLFLTQCDETIRASLLKGHGGIKKEAKRRRERKAPIHLLDNNEPMAASDLECLGEMCVEIFCLLLSSLPHFNFTNNIITTLVTLMTSKALQGKVSRLCCSTIESLFQNDSIGQVSYEAVQVVSRLVKSRGYKTKPAVLRTFLKLRLGDVEGPVAMTGSTAKKRKMSRDEGKRGKREADKKLSKKQKIRLVSELKLERDLEETRAVESKNKRAELQTEILKLVFLTYFRILKRSRHSPLLQAVLEGLAKFSHLINIDFFADLMSTLHSLAETGSLSNRECMLCVSTAFEILSGQGSSLTIDPRQFYVQLYDALLRLDARSSVTDLSLAVSCLEKMQRNIRKVPGHRALGFVKRMSTLTLQQQAGAALAVMAVIKKFLQSVSDCEQVLDVEAMATGGVFRPDVSDPDLSHASSTQLWEVAHLRLHYDPTVASYAKYLANGAPSHGRQALSPSLTRRTPADFLSSVESGKALKMNPDPMAGVPPPPAHPGTKLNKGQYWYSWKEHQKSAMK